MGEAKKSEAEKAVSTRAETPHLRASTLHQLALMLDVPIETFFKPLCPEVDHTRLSEELEALARTDDPEVRAHLAALLHALLKPN